MEMRLKCITRTSFAACLTILSTDTCCQSLQVICPGETPCHFQLDSIYRSGQTTMWETPSLDTGNHHLAISHGESFRIENFNWHADSGVHYRIVSWSQTMWPNKIIPNGPGTQLTWTAPGTLDLATPLPLANQYFATPGLTWRNSQRYSPAGAHLSLTRILPNHVHIEAGLQTHFASLYNRTTKRDGVSAHMDLGKSWIWNALTLHQSLDLQIPYWRVNIRTGGFWSWTSATLGIEFQWGDTLRVGPILVGHLTTDWDIVAAPSAYWTSNVYGKEIRLEARWTPTKQPAPQRSPDKAAPVAAKVFLASTIADTGITALQISTADRLRDIPPKSPWQAWMNRLREEPLQHTTSCPAHYAMKAGICLRPYCDEWLRDDQLSHTLVQGGSAELAADCSILADFIRYDKDLGLSGSYRHWRQLDGF